MVEGLTGITFGDGGGVKVVTGVAPEGANVVGAAGPEYAGGVTGTVGIGGIEGTTGGIIGDWIIVAGFDAVGGASAEILFVRKATLLSRAFNAPVEGGVRPPAAGSISSSHAPHVVTEST